jgi:hypothetical protein
VVFDLFILDQNVAIWIEVEKYFPWVSGQILVLSFKVSVVLRIGTCWSMLINANCEILSINVVRLLFEFILSKIYLANLPIQAANISGVCKETIFLLIGERLPRIGYWLNIERFHTIKYY